MSKPAVSVCIPTYNGARFLAQAIESAQAQTFSDLEILVVDDGSNDNTVALAGRYAQRDPRIQIHQNQRNLGLPGNWDRARELASGQWIAFLFQDDLFDPSYLARMIEAAGQPNTLIVCCRRQFEFSADISEATRDAFRAYIDRHDFAERFPRQAFVSSQSFCTQLAATPTTNFIGEPTAVLLHRSTLTEFGRFNASMSQLVDFEYWTRIAVLHGIAYVDAPLVTFRVHGSSATSANGRNAVRKDRLDSVILLHEYLHAADYAPLRASLRNHARILKHYAQRVAQLDRSDDRRDPGDPSWRCALDLYPFLHQASLTSRAAAWSYGLWQQRNERTSVATPSGVSK